jgi:hypothetical protein
MPRYHVEVEFRAVEAFEVEAANEEEVEEIALDRAIANGIPKYGDWETHIEEIAKAYPCARCNVTVKNRFYSDEIGDEVCESCAMVLEAEAGRNHPHLRIGDHVFLGATCGVIREIGGYVAAVGLGNCFVHHHLFKCWLLHPEPLGPEEEPGPDMTIIVEGGCVQEVILHTDAAEAIDYEIDDRDVDDQDDDDFDDGGPQHGLAAYLY